MNSAGLGILLSLFGIACSLTKTEFPGSEWTDTFLPRAASPLSESLGHVY